MRGRHRWGIVVAVIAGASIASCAEPADPLATESPTASVTARPSAGQLWGTPVRPPMGIHPFTLTDQEGRRFTFPTDAGRAEVILLYFGYTHCPDICPGTMAEIAIALQEVPREVAMRVAVVFVSVDPARDDPARLREWLGLFGEDFTGLTGSPRRIESILDSVGYRPGPVTDLGGGEYVVGHPVEFLAVAPDGTVRLAYPWNVSIPQLAEDLTRLVEEGWDT